MAPLKVVHTSDVHLDGRVADERVHGFRNGAERAFAAVVDVTIAEQADLFLIVGDLFDHARVDERDFEFVCEQLARTRAEVVLIPGNHDVHDERSVWHRIALADAGHHVRVMLEHDGETLEFDELNTRVWSRAMAEHAPDNVPLGNVPRRREGAWNIGLAHGQVVPKRAGLGSSQITHSEISESGFDYLALGHIHVWGDVSQGAVTACYPGSPVAAFASVHGGHVAVATLCPDAGVRVHKRLVDQRDA